jgi:nucleotide-binding universal stress UspA family protein
MFKNILIPVVDDMLTTKNMKLITDLVKADGANVTLVYISDPRAPFVYAKKASDYKISDASHKKACEQHAKEVLEKALKLVGKDVKAKVHHEFNATVYEGILEAAKKAKADAIMMASHKRTGLKGVFMGSDTHAVIVHSKLPVVVV